MLSVQSKYNKVRNKTCKPDLDKYAFPKKQRAKELAISRTKSNGIEYFKIMGTSPRRKFRARLSFIELEDGDSFLDEGNTYTLTNVVKVGKNLYEGEAL